MRKVDCRRFALVSDTDFVVVDTTAKKDIKNRPKWHIFENSHFEMRKRLNMIFLRVVNKLMCRLRAGKRLIQVKSWISARGIRTRYDMIKYVEMDFRRSINMQLAAGVDENAMHFEFKFKKL